MADDSLFYSINEANYRHLALDIRHFAVARFSHNGHMRFGLTFGKGLTKNRFFSLFCS
jgi:hypothetical protein